jgi:hypothetical protein
VGLATTAFMLPRVSFAQFGGTAVSRPAIEFAPGEPDAIETRFIDGRLLHADSNNQRKPETMPLLVPVERQPGVVHETARCQFRRIFAAKDRTDNVRR